MLNERPDQTIPDTADAPTGTAAKRTLYEISTDYAEFEQLMDQVDLAEITPEQQERIDAFLKDLTKERDKKFENCGGLIKEWEFRGNAQVEEGKRIKALGESKLNKAKYLKGRLLGFFQFHNITDAIETLRFKFKRAKNGGTLPLVFALDAQDDKTQGLPEEFIVRIPMPNTDLIREVLESEDDPRKELLAGVAWIGERGEHLRIS